MAFPPEQMPFDLGHAAAYLPEDFHVSDSNRAAAGWIERWPDWGAPLLIVQGPAGSGKTHLLKLWQARSGAVTVKTPAEIAGLCVGNATGFVIDDVTQGFLGRREDEEVLFHLYNHAAQHGQHILLTASAPVAAWDIVLPDLKSRLLAAPVAVLHTPDDVLMAVVLAKLFSDRQVVVPAEVIAFLLARMERSFAAAQTLVARIDQAGLAQKRAVTIPLVRALLEEKEGGA